MTRAAALALLAVVALAGCSSDDSDKPGDTWKGILKTGDPALVEQATTYAVQRCDEIADRYDSTGACVADQGARKYRELSK